MLHFRYTSTIAAPVATVWAFHERPDILETLTPPWQPVEILRREGGLGIGAISEFQLWLGPLPIRWLARHTACEPPHLFVDEQVDGPLEFWQHRHEFTAVGAQTQLTDAIAYALPGGEIAEALLGWWVEARLQDMFAYRHRVTREACEATANSATSAEPV